MTPISMIMMNRRLILPKKIEMKWNSYLLQWRRSQCCIVIENVFLNKRENKKTKRGEKAERKQRKRETSTTDHKFNRDYLSQKSTMWSMAAMHSTQWLTAPKSMLAMSRSSLWLEKKSRYLFLTVFRSISSRLLDVDVKIAAAARAAPDDSPFVEL